MDYRLLTIGVSCFVLIVAGCAGVGSLLPDFPDWNARKLALENMEKWEFNARIAVSSETDGFTGRLRWHQDGSFYQAQVSGPFGSGAVYIKGNGAGLSLTDKEGVVTAFPDAEHDLIARYGWTIPVKSLRFWVLGIPDPSVPAEVELNKSDQLDLLRQRGWEISIELYAVSGGQLMPERLTAVSGNNRVRLIIDNWLFH